MSSENSIYKVYSERELLERQTYMGPVHEIGGGVTKSYDWTGAVTSKDVWVPLGSNRWIISQIIINTTTTCTVTLFDEEDNEANRVFKGEIAGETVVISYPIPRPSSSLNKPLQITTGGGAGYVTIWGWESGVGVVTTTTSVSTSSSSSISSSSSSVSTSSVSTSSVSSSSSSVSTSSVSSSSSSISSSSSSSSSTSSSSQTTT